jgi:hypothetical protein
MYRIVETTDGRFVGREIDVALSTKSIFLDDFEFEIVELSCSGGKVKLTSSNYIVKAVEVENV